MGKSMADFNFRTVTTKFNELVYQYPIRVPERYALVIRWVPQGLGGVAEDAWALRKGSGPTSHPPTCIHRSLLTQEGVCLSIDPNFQFLAVAYPYIARRLLTDPDPSLRSRLIQVWRGLGHILSHCRMP